MKFLATILLFIAFDSFNCFAQGKQIIIPLDESSVSSCYVLCYREHKLLGNATGFFMDVDSRLYFITNNHNVGEEFFRMYYKAANKNNEPPTELFPDSLSIRVYGNHPTSSKTVGLPLFSKSGKPNYLKIYTDPQKLNTIEDIVAFPLDSTWRNALANTFVFPFSMYNENLLLFPADELFVIGFPYEMGQRTTLPIWKRGTIASEPNLQAIGKTDFYIDATARPGMSGSPVIFRGYNYREFGGDQIQTQGPAKFLVGIFHSYYPKDEVGVVTRLSSLLRTLKKITANQPKVSMQK